MNIYLFYPLGTEHYKASFKWRKLILGLGGTPGNSWWGCAILTLFQTKKCHFPHSFSDQTSKIHNRFQTWPLGRNYVIIT